MTVWRLHVFEVAACYGTVHGGDRDTAGGAVDVLMRVKTPRMALLSRGPLGVVGCKGLYPTK